MTAGVVPDLGAHALALALRGRCAFCAEIALDPGVLRGARCSSCGGQAADPRLGELVFSEYRERSGQYVAAVLGLTAVLALVLGCVPLLGFVPLVLGVVAMRVAVVSPALHLMSRGRRLVSRWTLRLLVAATLAVGGAVITLVMSIPAVNAVASCVWTSLVLGIAWWASRSYLLWQLERERAAAPVGTAEVLLLLGTLTLAFAFTAALVSAVVVAWTFLQGVVGSL